MGRELRRVALDFKHPLKKTWPGFVNHHWQKARQCPSCEHGDSPFANKLYRKWWGYTTFNPEERGSTPHPWNHPAFIAQAERNFRHDPMIEDELYKKLYIRSEANRLANLANSKWMHHLSDDDVAALLKADRYLRVLTHDRREGGWVKKDPPVIPTAAQVNDYFLTDWTCSEMLYTVMEAECERHNEPMVCSVCDGDAHIWDNESDREAYESWTPTPPPSGEGFQMWETTSEGSPISPVFDTAESLARWLANNYASSFGDDTATYEEWLQTIRIGYAVGSVYTEATGVISGVQANAIIEKA